MFKKFVFSLALVAMISAMASASLLYNLKILEVNDVPWAGDEHAASVTPGTKVLLGIYATVDSGTDQSVSAGTMRFTSTETGLCWGDLSEPTCSWPLTTLGAAAQYDANPDDEWGGNYPATVGTANYYYFADSAAHAGAYHDVGTILWTGTSDDPGQSTLIEAVPYENTKNPAVRNCLWTDPVNHLNEDDATGMGVTLTCVPEPATLALLGMSALALLAIRRRK